MYKAMPRAAPDLPRTTVSYDAPALARRLRAGEALFHSYDVAAFRVLEAAGLSAARPPSAWRSIQRFPALWSRLATTGGEHRIVKRDVDAADIAVGNVICADAIVLGTRLAMANEVTAIVDGERFQLSVRALGGWFESEVEARIFPWPEGTLLIWRQAYTRRRLASFLTARVLSRREENETRRILELWREDLASA
jgi:hypothetical protein